MPASSAALTTIDRNVGNKQTGPRTAAGKAISSNNATLHGGTSLKSIIPGEDPAEFQALLNGLLEDYRPETSQSRLLVENFAAAQWFVWRRQRAHNIIEVAIYESEPDQSKWTTDHLKKLALADRYTIQAERSLTRALAHLQSEQKLKNAEANRELRRTQSEAAQALRERRITLQEQKLQFAKSRAEATQAFRSAKSAAAPSQKRNRQTEPAAAPSQNLKNNGNQYSQLIQASDEPLP